MFELNLIRDKIHIFGKRKRVLYYFRLFYMVSALLFIVMVVRSVVVSMSIMGNKRSLVAIQEGIDRDKKRYEIDKVEKEWRTFYRNAALIRDVYEKKSAWSEKLQDLVSLMGTGMCINEISLAADNSKMGLRIAVLPTDKQGFEIINEVISTLERENFAAPGVKLDGQEKTKFNDKPLEVFKLSVPLKS